MIILGIDPGLASTGFGLVETEKGTFKAIDYGCISTSPKTPLVKRLKKIFLEIKSIIKRNKPDLIVIEELFFANNAKTAIKVGQARGVAILACAEAKCEITELTPLQVKMFLTSYGRASKKQIQQMVKLRLNLEKIPTPDDAADALAIAICGAKINRVKLRNKYEI
jgi:crossover junction endodeoxyribonuclease RuvC